MVLVERKEAIEKFLGELFSTIDCMVYGPLHRFINIAENVCQLVDVVTYLQRIVRKFLNKCNLKLVSVFDASSFWYDSSCVCIYRAYFNIMPRN